MSPKKLRYTAVLVALLFVFSFAAYAEIEGCAGEVWGENCRVWAVEKGRCVKKVLDDCCGNDVCEESSEESFGVCPADCLPESLEFEIIKPNLNQGFLLGDSVLVNVGYASESSVKCSTPCAP